MKSKLYNVYKITMHNMTDIISNDLIPGSHSLMGHKLLFIYFLLFIFCH